MSSGATLLNGFMLPKLGTAGWAWVEVALPYNLAVQVCSAPKGTVFGPFGQKCGIDFGQFDLTIQVLSSGHVFFCR